MTQEQLDLMMIAFLKGLPLDPAENLEYASTARLQQLIDVHYASGLMGFWVDALNAHKSKLNKCFNPLAK